MIETYFSPGRKPKLSSIPNFEFYNGRMIKPRQEPYFTVFVFAEGLSDFLMGLEEIAAYDVLEHAGYDQFFPYLPTLLVVPLNRITDVRAVQSAVADTRRSIRN